ncbi:MAG TPA: ATP synthase F1 subunit epsilon [Terracidiphilus sp.]|jgi:F-type H+-transporting ATPase subunit epsilon
METNQIRVRLVTPERVLFERMADSVELPSKTGYMEVLYGHAPLLAELGAGDVTLNGANGSERYNVSWGFVEVLGDRVTILANDALKPSEIDLPRAEKQLAHGQDEWNQAGESEEAYDEALRIIAEAEAKISSAKNQ